METYVVKIHSSDLIGTCDKSGECSTLNDQLQALENMGIDPEATEIITEHRKEMCALAEQLNLLLEPALRSPPEFSSWLSYQYWRDTSRFLV